MQPNMVVQVVQVVKVVVNYNYHAEEVLDNNQMFLGRQPRQHRQLGQLFECGFEPI